MLCQIQGHPPVLYTLRASRENFFVFNPPKKHPEGSNLCFSLRASKESLVCPPLEGYHRAFLSWQGHSEVYCFMFDPLVGHLNESIFL